MNDGWIGLDWEGDDDDNGGADQFNRGGFTAKSKNAWTYVLDDRDDWTVCGSSPYLIDTRWDGRWSRWCTLRHDEQLRGQAQIKQQPNER